MASLAAAPPLGGQPVARLPRLDGRTLDWLIFAGVVLCAAVLTGLDLPGYFGGRWDDGRYLEAALAWVDHGPSLGTTHWALRWPTVLPTALSIELFGRNRTAAMLPFIGYFAVLLTINFWALRRFFGAGVAALTLLALITIGEIMVSVTRLTAELPELVFLSAGVWAFIAASVAGPRQRTLMLAAGVAAGLAWATRETSLSLAVAFAAAFAIGLGPRRALYPWLAAGFLGVALPEQLMLWHASGDWLYRLHTDLRHIEVPSTNLRGLVAPGQFAPLNAAIAARWTGIGPVHLHWALDTWLNLFFNARYGLIFLLAGFAALALAVTGGRPRGGWTLTGTIAALGALHIATVLYVIATDPKARMFMPAMLAAAVILALCLVPLWQQRRARALIVVSALVKLIVVVVAISVAGVFNRGYPALAEQVARAAPGPIHANRWTRSRLDLGPPALRARLADGLPPVGGLWLTSGNIKDDARLDTIPPPEARWQVIDRVVSSDAPFSLPLIELATRESGRDIIAGFSPVVVLYRRLPGLSQPLPAPER